MERFAVAQSLGEGQPMAGGIKTEAGARQGPDGLTARVGAFDPASNGWIKNPPIAMGAIAGTIEAQVGGLNRGKAVVQKPGPVIGRMAAKIQQHLGLDLVQQRRQLGIGP